MPVRLRSRLPLLLAISTAFLGVALSTLWAPDAAGAGGWTSPLRPFRLTRAFDRLSTPYAPGHRGADLGGAVDEPVLAASAGTVSFAGLVAGRPVVVVSHGALRTTYEPVRATVRRGVTVAGGEQIGVLEAGHAGCPVAACLHLGLLRGDTYLDPIAMLSPPVIRLFPPAGPAGPGASASTLGASSAPASTAKPGALSAWTGASRRPDRVTATPARPDDLVISPAAAWSAAALAGGGAWLMLRRR